MTRLERALQVRDQAVAFLKAHGQWQHTAHGPKVLTAQKGTLRLVLRTPFKLLPRPKPTTREGALLAERAPNLPYGLDIWQRPAGKVLNIEWDDNGAVELIGFMAGAWDAEFPVTSSSEDLAADWPRIAPDRR